jgi:bisphosphoglycerate-dependent phosphoglycerate mutase
MDEKEFIKKVLRINPDIIYSTNLIRSQKTAQQIKKILKEYLNKDIEIIEEEKLRTRFIKNNISNYFGLLEKEK